MNKITFLLLLVLFSGTSVAQEGKYHFAIGTVNVVETETIDEVEETTTVESNEGWDCDLGQNYSDPNYVEFFKQIESGMVGQYYMYIDFNKEIIIQYDSYEDAYYMEIITDSDYMNSIFYMNYNVSETIFDSFVFHFHDNNIAYEYKTNEQTYFEDDPYYDKYGYSVCRREITYDPNGFPN